MSHRPLRATRAVMERSVHVLKVGAGAEAFAESMGLEMVSPDYFSTEARREQLRRALADVATALAQHASAGAFVLKGPIAIRIQTQTPALADLFCQWPTLERLGGDEVAFSAPTVEAAVRMINCLSAMSTFLR